MSRDEMQSKYKEAVQKAMSTYARCIEQRDFIGCVKQVGVMEYLGIPDTDYHLGFAYHMNQEFEKAVPYFKAVAPSSEWYKQASYSLAIDYARLGQYLELDRLLNSKAYCCSALEEMQLRVQSVEHAKPEYLKEHREEMAVLSSTDISPKQYEGEDAQMFFQICCAFVIGLVMAGECINQCALYKRRTGKRYSEFTEVSELSRYFEEYERWCSILSLSKHLKVFKLPDTIDSLSKCALSDKTWEEKIAIFNSTTYVKQIMQIIFNICCPELHSHIEAYTAVDKIMEAFIQIEPRSIAQMVDHYFDVVSEAYSRENNSAAQYLGYVYSEILATGQDPFGLKERIDAIRLQDGPYADLGADADSIRLARKMSRKGHDAYVNAKMTFSKSNDIVQGSHDYSALSLQFFRVLEIEYCEKLIIPLAQKVDIENLHKLADQSNDDRNCKSWHYDAKCLDKIKTGGQDSFEIGAVRTLLGHIVGYYTKDDPCAVYLKPLVESLLTEDGKKALQSKEMLDVIGNAVLEKYRVPGAHTGFLPYSTACESKDYVKANLQKVISWFN